MAQNLFGIDFGACNLKCVRAYEKKVRPIQLNTSDDGFFHTPNALFYRNTKSGDLEKVIGQSALNYGTTTPENLVVGLKRKLEQKDWRQFIPTLNREVAAQEVTSDIFKKIFDMATKNVPAGEESHAAVTVPVIFTKLQRNLIKTAAESAGFKVDAVINESFAAIFGVDAQEDSLNVIFDFGGSTLDVSIIKFGKDEVQELVAAGIRLGGLDIDRLILEKILKPKLGDKLADRWQGDNADDFQMTFARDVKEKLYADEFNDSIDVGTFYTDLDCEFSRAEVDALLDSDGYREKIVALLDKLFEDLAQEYDFTKDNITKVWAMGGSMRIPYFTNLLENYFGEELFKADEYYFEDDDGLIEGLTDKYLIVAGGAANFLKQRENVTVINAIPYCICYSLGKSLGPGIKKNAPAGFETVEKTLNLTELDNFGWKISLYQTFGDEANFDDAAYLGEVALNPAQYDKTEPPMIKMKIMRDGRLRLRFTERRVIDGEGDIILVEEHFLNLDN